MRHPHANRNPDYMLGSGEKGGKKDLTKAVTKQECFSSRWSMKSERRYFIKYAQRGEQNAGWWIAPKPQMNGPCSTGQEGSLPERKCWLSFLLEIATIWAWAPMSRLPSDSKWAQLSLYISICKVFLVIFLRLLWCDTMKDCICGWCSHLVSGCQLSAMGCQPSSLKQTKWRAQSCSSYWKEELHSDQKIWGQGTFTYMLILARNRQLSEARERELMCENQLRM